MTKTKILVVEDDRSLAKVLAYNLTQAGYEVRSAYDGQDAITQARLQLPDVVVLDVMIPIFDGLEVCRRLRAQEETANIAIIMLTAKGEETDQLMGFTVGADDYVTKPFSVKILLQRIKAVDRRRKTEDGQSNVVNRGGISIDRLKFRAMVGDRILDLTPSEFRLLDTLIRQPGRAFDRSELIDAALGADTVVLERTIDVHIRSLRKKLGDANSSNIETVRGVGYRFSEMPVESGI